MDLFFQFLFLNLVVIFGKHQRTRDRLKDFFFDFDFDFLKHTLHYDVNPPKKIDYSRESRGAVYLEFEFITTTLGSNTLPSNSTSYATSSGTVLRIFF